MKELRENKIRGMLTIIQLKLLLFPLLPNRHIRSEYSKL
jgi:hypothetical protein